EIIVAVGSNMVLHNKKLSLELRKPFSLFVKTVEKSAWLRIVDDVRTILQKQEGYVYIPDLR
ncbi:hypothetical protein KKE14_00915, partial [Patescibacteria group bacterium]|nr:hypothetical protein [Patescibacteria group bacterium]